MQPNYIALAVPLFFVFIGVELWLARRRDRSSGGRWPHDGHARRPLYRLNDAVNDLSCGMTQQLVLLLTQALLLGIYVRVYQHRLLSLSPLAAWGVAFVGVDLLYYWWHRLSHEVNLLWAAHVVHHQSEDYNLAVALRQSALTSWTTLPFYLPLGALGVPPVIYVTMVSFSTLYQFWIHTQLVGKLPRPLEWALNTPSHHRVHHAINPRYLDKNYGAIFIVWDRLFGTFAVEDEAPVYGITKRLGSFDPLWAQVHYFFDMGRLARAARRLGERLQVPWRGPAWSPSGAAPPPTRSAGKYDPPLSRRARVAVLVLFPPVLVATFLLMWFGARVPLGWRAVGVGASLGMLQLVGAILDHRRASWRNALP